MLPRGQEFRKDEYDEQAGVKEQPCEYQEGLDVYKRQAVDRHPDNKVYMTGFVDAEGNDIKIENPSATQRAELPFKTE